MYMDEAERLRKERGGKPCDHPSISKEREERGAHTGDFVCDQCGKLYLSREEWESDRGKATGGQQPDG